MQINQHYPKHPPTVGSVLLTSYESFAHQNEIPKARAAEALKIGEQIAGGFDDDSQHLAALMLLLSDVPEDPLLKASAAQKGSVLGLASLSYVIFRHSAGAKARQILNEGGGVFLVKLTGVQDAPGAEIQIFSTWQEYQIFLEPILRGGDFGSENVSSFS
ncbi:hypothetical protein KDX38_11570 [Pseudomonas sp. CDFA 602]|uniref:hypothetical protein n=1 Tax=Pseudomonas californiensis TaxID=2829823 RepID=UPI001E3712E4|nr:hypothetical protein [Pseudomonas californiensis]MCD5994045.1 hypothetical protein [Pseudomonas californiensis]MCD5999856.1 hypothetical protein [Pseudomonas californiensis]